MSIRLARQTPSLSAVRCCGQPRCVAGLRGRLGTGEPRRADTNQPLRGGGCALGSHMPTVGEDHLPLHELSTKSKRTTCLPPHMVCEVHHTKSGYEQLKSRNSPFRPTRSLSSPKRMRYDRFRSRCEAAGHLPARGDRRFCRAARSQMGCFARCSVVRVTPSGSPTAEGLLLTSAVEKRRSRRRNGPAALLSDIADEQFCRKL